MSAATARVEGRLLVWTNALIFCAGDEVIMSTAGHVSAQCSRYPHVMQSTRRALDEFVARQRLPTKSAWRKVRRSSRMSRNLSW